MAEYQELLDVIAAVRQQSGDQNAWMSDLSTTDLMVATNPMLSSPDRIAGVISKIRLGHPDVFTSHHAEGGAAGGSAVDAIRLAEAALARQNSRAAALDLQVITAILNAHSVNSEGQRKLSGIQEEIERAVSARTDLDTPAGAQDFQRYLLGKLHEMRTVVDAVGVDATSKATLSAALASLYAADSGHEGSGLESGVADDWPDDELFDPLQWPIAASPIAAQWTPESLNSVPSVAQEVPGPAPVTPGPTLPPPVPLAPLPPASSMPFAPGLPSLAPLGSLSELAGPELAGPELAGLEPTEAEQDEPEIDDTEPADLEDDESPDEQVDPDDPNMVVLPDGESVIAGNPAIAKAITAAVQGMPIAEAFRQQGITIPAPGSPVLQPVEPTELKPGDIGIYVDRHALAIGGGKALLNNQIQAVEVLPELGFMGWQDALAQAQPVDEPAPTTPELTTAAPSE